jgi:2-polyprenyl-3-methyl-5-hydroxy-6-metoxy-1,4-benzoquinol methylase
LDSALLRAIVTESKSMSQSSDTPFSEAAPHYRFRAPYAPEALAHVQAAFRLDKSSRALDLGCGPGTLAIPLSRMVGDVFAIDPSAAMIREGRAQGEAAGCANIKWHCSRAEEVTKELGTFSVVTIGQAFHWMERDLVLCKLASMIAEGGGLAVINPGRRRPQESWETLASEVVARYLGPRPRHENMNVEPENEPALRRSRAFSRFTTREFAMDFTRDVPSIIGYVYSMSTSPRSAFRERVSMFERELTQALLSANPSGVFKERLETEVLLAPVIIDD